MTDHALVLAVLLGADSLFSGCSSPATIGDIPPERGLVDLNADQTRMVCDWSAELAAVLPKSGTQLTCDNLPAVFKRPSVCDFPKAQPQGCYETPGNGTVCGGPNDGECLATVAEYRECIPKLIDEIAADPCSTADIANQPIPNERGFIEATPGCKGFSSCGIDLDPR